MRGSVLDPSTLALSPSSRRSYAIGADPAPAAPTLKLSDPYSTLIEAIAGIVQTGVASAPSIIEELSPSLHKRNLEAQTAQTALAAQAAEAQAASSDSIVKTLAIGAGALGALGVLGYVLSRVLS